MSATPARRAGAQAAAADTSRVSAFTRLRPGMRVRVAWPDGTVLSGKLVVRTPDSLVIWDGRIRQNVALGSVTGIWQAHGRATFAGARAGGVIGAVTGATLGLLLGGAGCELRCGRARSSGLVVGIGTGMAVGALAGAGAGTLVPRWHRVFP